MPNIVTRYFSSNSQKVFTISNNILSCFPRMYDSNSIYRYCHMGSNSGYLDSRSTDILIMYDNTINRICRRDFEYIKSMSKVVTPCRYKNVVSIKYDLDDYPDSKLSIDANYKIRQIEAIELFRNSGLTQVQQVMMELGVSMEQPVYAYELPTVRFRQN